MTLCPTCNSTLLRRHDETVGAVIVVCRVCKKVSAEGLYVWLDHGPRLAEQIKGLLRQAKEDEERHQRFMTSPISDPWWTDISP